MSSGTRIPLIVLLIVWLPVSLFDTLYIHSKMEK